MDDDDKREPDHTDDPRGTDVAGGGYPEEGPAGADPHGGKRRSGGDTGAGAPQTSTEDEDDREASTGNPAAAG